MKNRFNIYSSLERSFLAVQQQIKKLRQGSVIRSLLYSVAAELEVSYEDIDAVKRNMYVNTATGGYLDSLIQGWTKLSRRRATFAVGYVEVEFGQALSVQDLRKLNFAFAGYNLINNTSNHDLTGVVKLTVENKGKARNYYVCHPLSFDVTPDLLRTDPTTGKQRIFSMYVEYLGRVVTTTGKPVRKLVLPIVSEEGGRAFNLQAAQVEAMSNLGVPVMIRNAFNVSVKDSESVADVDGVLSLMPGTDDYRVLGDYAYITGGEDEETDEAYRNRYYLYLDSLSRGTLSSLEFAVKSFVPNVRVKAIESGVPGMVTVFIDSPHVVSKNIINSVNEIVKDYRSAGILVALRTTKVEHINVLLDVDAGNLDSATEKIRGALNSLLEDKNLAETLSYTEIHEGLDLQGITKLDNVFYGKYIAAEDYAKYFNTIVNVMLLMSPTFAGVSDRNYMNFFTTVVQGDVTLFSSVDDSISYPLVQLIRRAREMDVSALDVTSKQFKIAKAIQTYCGGSIKAKLCLDMVRDQWNNADDGELTVTIRDLGVMVGDKYANYFKIKMLTLPFVGDLVASEAEAAIEFFMRNDVINLSYEDLREAPVAEFSRLRLSKNAIVNEKLYTINSLVATRAVER